MNVIILTPDRVGSTLLQRLITVYANINEAPDQLTINLHELTNGIVNYHNDSFNRTVLGKKEGHWGYHQNLQTVTELLKNSNMAIPKSYGLLLKSLAWEIIRFNLILL